MLHPDSGLIPNEEPCCLTYEDAPAMFEPPPPPGPAWWEGWWPRDGISSLCDLEWWVDFRLTEMIMLGGSDSKTLRSIGRSLGRQTVANAIRYLARSGRENYPARPRPDQLRDQGGIEAALETLLRYIRQEQKGGGAVVVAAVSTTQPDPEAKHQPVGQKRATGEPKLRSWTQADLDAAIYKFKAERSSSYKDLVEGVRRGLPGAIKTARRTFGRNVIATALGVKAPAMVTRSPAWQGIAAELRLGREVGRRIDKAKRISMEIATDRQAADEGTSALDVVVKNETISLIRKSLPEEAAARVINLLETGQVSDEQARDILQTYTEQQKDSRSRRAL